MAIPYDYRFTGTSGDNSLFRERQMAKKQKQVIPEFNWEKFFKGAKRPLIAIIIAIAIGFGFDVDETVAGAIGLLVERAVSTVVFYIKREEAKLNK